MHYCFDYISPELKSILEPATQQCHFTGEKLQVHEYPNGMIAPFVDWKKSIGGILSHDGTVIKDSECKEWKESDLYYSPANAKTEDKTVIFLGFMPRAFGHAFNDCLRKIWFINCDFCRCLLEEGAEFVYTAQENETLPSYFFETFRLAGFELSQARQITELTRFKSVSVPENCVIAEDDGRVYTNEYKQLIDNVVHSIPRAGEGTYPKRVYFTRTHIKSSKEQGEQAIEQQFKRLGYTIISPELYPVTTQIDIVRDCTHFAATEGSVAHHSLFCKPGTKVTLINKANYLNMHQVMINEFADLDVTYVEAHHSSRANKECPWWGPFYMCVTRYLEEYVGHRILHLPYWMKISYWRYSQNFIMRAFHTIKRPIFHFLGKG